MTAARTSLVAQMARKTRGIALLLLSLMCTACSTKVVAPSFSGGLEDKSPHAAWERVLASKVDEKGRIDFSGLQEDFGDLENYVSYVQKVSPNSHPEAFPNDDSRLAYYLNSYNALAMYGVLKRGVPKDLDGIFKRYGFFINTKFTIGGENRSLYDYENNLIRKLEEPRIHFALNCMSVGCPRLPQTPFLGPVLQDQLQAGAEEFFNSETYVQVDHENKTVLISEILDFFTEDFVKPGVADSLPAYVNKFRKVPVPTDYEVDFIPYDWTINTQ